MNPAATGLTCNICGHPVEDHDLEAFENVEDFVDCVECRDGVCGPIPPM